MTRETGDDAQLHRLRREKAKERIDSCCDNACLKRCQKTRGLDRAFREHVNDSVYAALEKEFTKLNEGHGEADGAFKA